MTIGQKPQNVNLSLPGGGANRKSDDDDSNNSF
jgi:hypothetical protein